MPTRCWHHRPPVPHPGTDRRRSIASKITMVTQREVWMLSQRRRSSALVVTCDAYFVSTFRLSLERSTPGTSPLAQCLDGPMPRGAGWPGIGRDGRDNARNLAICLVVAVDFRLPV